MISYENNDKSNCKERMHDVCHSRLFAKNQNAKSNSLIGFLTLFITVSKLREIKLQQHPLKSDMITVYNQSHEP